MEKTLIAVLIAASVVLTLGLWVTLSRGPLEMEFTVVMLEGAVEKDLQIDEFFFVNYMNDDVFGRFNLEGKLGIVEKTKLLEKMMHNLSYETPVILVVKNYQKNKSLLIGLLLKDTKEGEQTILLMSNYDVLKKRILRQNESIENSYAKIYYIVAGKVVNLNDMYSEELEQKYREECLNNVANLFLVDNLAENDQYIESLLLEQLDTTDNLGTKFITTLTLAQYYDSINNEDMFLQTMAQADQLQNEHEELNHPAYLKAYRLTAETHEIVKIMQSNQAEE